MSLPSPTPAIEIRDLRVDYGNFVAVNDISLTVDPGEVYGMVGPNGAGKSSTFRVLATLNRPTYGDVKLCGLDLFEQTEDARRLLGYMPDLAPVPSDLKAWEFLDLYAHAYGLGSSKKRRERIDQCLEEVHLNDKRDAWCRALSRGQTQRLVLAKCLLHRPRVIVLDEPASGMDPLSRRDLRMTLRKLASDGVAVIVSSHILSELADMCTSRCADADAHCAGRQRRNCRQHSSHNSRSFRTHPARRTPLVSLHWLRRGPGCITHAGHQSGCSGARV
jgi:ABC-2 type transport system ATP-binding protein